MSEKPAGRKTAYEALVKMARDGAYSNLTLDAALSGLTDGREKQFAAALFYGVLERKLTLDFQIERHSKKKLSALDHEVAAALELALYQLYYMDSVPPSAAVNESVNLIKSSRKKSAAGFVNAVLRNVLREGKKIQLPQGDKFAKAAVEFSIPVWILKRWAADFSFEEAVRLAEACFGRPPLHLRVNTLKTTTAELMNRLQEEGITVSHHAQIPNCLTVSGVGSIAAFKVYREGLCYVQDASSQLCAMALGARAGERIFDLCAAPGSKSFTISQWMEGAGEIHAFDLHPKRVALITEGAKRFGLTNIHPETGDALKFYHKLPAAHRILCDVPCSGLGVMGRKPEIKYKPESEAEALPSIQLAILENGARYLQKDGILLYSTCALNSKENQEVVKEFLVRHPDFAPEPLPEAVAAITGKPGHEAVITPLLGEFDGFFLGKMRKIR